MHRGACQACGHSLITATSAVWMDRDGRSYHVTVLVPDDAGPGRRHEADNKASGDVPEGRHRPADPATEAVGSDGVAHEEIRSEQIFEHPVAPFLGQRAWPPGSAGGPFLVIKVARRQPSFASPWPPSGSAGEGGRNTLAPRGTERATEPGATLGATSTSSVVVRRLAGAHHRDMATAALLAAIRAMGRADV